MFLRRKQRQGTFAKLDLQIPGTELNAFARESGQHLRPEDEPPPQRPSFPAPQAAAVEDVRPQGPRTFPGAEFASQPRSRDARDLAMGLTPLREQAREGARRRQIQPGILQQARQFAEIQGTFSPQRNRLFAEQPHERLTPEQRIFRTTGQIFDPPDLGQALGRGAGAVGELATSGLIPGVPDIANIAPIDLLFAGLATRAITGARAAGREVPALFRPIARTGSTAGDVAAVVGGEEIGGRLGFLGGQAAAEGVGLPGIAGGVPGAILGAGAGGVGLSQALRQSAPEAVEAGARNIDTFFERGTVLTPEGLALPATVIDGSITARRIAGGAEGEKDVVNRLLDAIEQEQTIRRSGTAAREIAEGRAEQLGGITPGLREAREAGLGGEAATQAATAGTQGRLRQTVAGAVPHTPEERDQLFDLVGDALIEGRITDGEYLRLIPTNTDTGVVDRLLLGEGLEPAQITLAKKVFGNDFVEAAAKRQKFRVVPIDPGIRGPGSKDFHLAFEENVSPMLRQGAERAQQLADADPVRIQARLDELDQTITQGGLLTEARAYYEALGEQRILQRTLVDAVATRERAAIAAGRREVAQRAQSATALARQRRQQRLTSERARLAGGQLEAGLRQRQAVEEGLERGRQFQPDGSLDELAEAPDLPEQIARGLARQGALEQLATPEFKAELREVAKALKRLTDADAKLARDADRASARHVTQQAAQARQEQRAMVAQAIDHQEGLERAFPNVEQLIRKVVKGDPILPGDARTFGIENMPEGLREGILDFYTEWVRGSRAILDTYSSDSDFLRRIGWVISGQVPNSYVGEVIRRRSLLRRGLEMQGLPPVEAARLADLDAKARLVERFGEQIPADVDRMLKRAHLGEADSLMQEFVQLGKRLMFGLVDIGIFGQQLMKAVREGGIPLAIGLVNRMATALNHPLAPIMYAESALPKKLQYTIDGFDPKGSSGLFDIEADRTLISKIPKIGRMIDAPLVAWTNAMDSLQFGFIMGAIRNLVYEGNLVMAHAVRADIQDPAVRRRIAAMTRNVTSEGERATRPGRSIAEDLIFISQRMTRAMIGSALQQARFFDPRPSKFFPTTSTREQRIVAAGQILSTAGVVMLLSKVLDDRFGDGTMEIDPSKPASGILTLPGGASFQLVPQAAFHRAVAKSVRAIAEEDPAVIARAWSNFFTGRTSLVGNVAVGGTTGLGRTAEGLQTTDLSVGERIQNVVPVPPVINTALTEGADIPILLGESFGFSSFRDVGSAVEHRIRTGTDVDFLTPEELAGAQEDLELTGQISPLVIDRLGEAEPETRAAIRGDVGTAIDEARADIQPDIEALGDPTTDLSINALRWNDEYKLLRAELSGTIQNIINEAGLPERDPSHPLAIYDRIITENTEGREIDWDAVDVALAQEDQAVQDFIGRNTGLGGTAVEKKRRAAVAFAAETGAFRISEVGWQNTISRASAAQFAIQTSGGPVTLDAFDSYSAFEQWATRLGIRGLESQGFQSQASIQEEAFGWAKANIPGVSDVEAEYRENRRTMVVSWLNATIGDPMQEQVLLWDLVFEREEDRVVLEDLARSQ